MTIIKYMSRQIKIKPLLYISSIHAHLPVFYSTLLKPHLLCKKSSVLLTFCLGWLLHKNPNQPCLLGNLLLPIPHNFIAPAHMPSLFSFLAIPCSCIDSHEPGSKLGAIYIFFHAAKHVTAWLINHSLCCYKHCNRKKPGPDYFLNMHLCGLKIFLLFVYLSNLTCLMLWNNTNFIFYLFACL